MKKIPLLPGYFKWIGIVLTLLSLALYFYDNEKGGIDLRAKVFAIVDDSLFRETSILKIVETEIRLTMILITAILGLAFIAFSRRQIEDEMIRSLRLHSWSWSVAVMTLIFLFFAIFFYGLSFLNFTLMFPYLLLLSYILIFQISLLRLNREVIYEK
ncbi:MAG: hypothetical protein ABS46_07015 [Cytophagaceae bacterium SCN 52-12]|nr:MAG: hypothetical protein ABS46_07015 [Cytophagaceae bacterium SCN 52-12]